MNITINKYNVSHTQTQILVYTKNSTTNFLHWEGVVQEECKKVVSSPGDSGGLEVAAVEVGETNFR